MVRKDLNYWKIGKDGDRFRHFTNLDVQNVFEVIAPILKSLRLTPSEPGREQIVEDNRLILQKLIDTTKVTYEF